MAARVGGIGANQAHPADLYLDNLLMGTYVIEQARRSGTPKTVVIGTICSYPKHTPVPFSEDSLWQGYPEETNAPYGVAKLAQLVQAQANRQQYGQNVIYLMPTNLYGPGDNFHPTDGHLVPMLMRRFHEAKLAGDSQLRVWGTGAPRRELMHVDDLADACLFLMANYDEAGFVNVGTGIDETVATIAGLLRDIIHPDADLRFDPSRPDGMPRKVLDVRRIHKLGWHHRIDLADGLASTYDWFTRAADIRATAPGSAPALAARETQGLARRHPEPASAWSGAEGIRRVDDDTSRT
jgi:GDP-L-fucose synthase